MDLKILSHNIAQDQTGYDSIDALIINTNADICDSSDRYAEIVA